MPLLKYIALPTAFLQAKATYTSLANSVTAISDMIQKNNHIEVELVFFIHK